jgi:tetratricopeptide (TPR) repeat protein
MIHRALVHFVVIFIAWLAVLLDPANSLAQSGPQTINGTAVYTEIDQARGVATFSNDCGSQTLTQGQLQAGAIPSQIIPCPRPNSAPRSGASHPVVPPPPTKSPEEVANENQKKARERRLQQRLEESKATVDPQLQFDALVLAGQADTAYHAGQYERAVQLLEKAIDIYGQIKQPLARTDLVEKKTRVDCKWTIRRAHDAASPEVARREWEKAISGPCRQIPEELKYARTYFAKLAPVATANSQSGRGQIKGKQPGDECLVFSPVNPGIACNGIDSLTAVVVNNCSRARKMQICLEKRTGEVDCKSSAYAYPVHAYPLSSGLLGLI